MGIKSVGYGVTSTGLDVMANIPGGLGKGFLFVGNFLVGVSTVMRNKAAEYRSISRGLDLLDAQTVAIADVEAYVKEKGCSFNEALVAVAGKIKDSDTAEKDKAPAAEKDEDAVVVVEKAVAGTAQKIVVEDEDGDIRSRDTSAVMSVAAGLA